VLGVVWFIALVWCAATKRFDLSEKVFYTSLVAFLPIFPIIGFAIYERRAKRKSAVIERRDLTDQA